MQHAYCDGGNAARRYRRHNWRGRRNRLCRTARRCDRRGLVKRDQYAFSLFSSANGVISTMYRSNRTDQFSI